MNRTLAGFAAAGFTIIGLAGCGAGGSTAPTPNGVTLAAFQQVHDGMTLAQVQSILGSAGKLTLSWKTPPVTTENYQWGEVSTGHWVTIGFQNDAAMMEMEFGL